MRNIYACLVHESQECIVDLVHNLRTLDPTSIVLLYNGGPTPGLLEGFPFARYEAVVVPHPRRMTWGYLHPFALECMRFALEYLTFDTLTIVDSDQLAIRGDYSRFLGSFWSRDVRTGMYVSDPSPEAAHASGPARAMLDEIDLWLPLFGRFGRGAEAVRWTFWPSTVFTQACARDLVELVTTSDELQSIIDRSSVWATEEVLFPTLAHLLGFELTANPCNGGYVRFASEYSIEDLASALAAPDAFWMHPVPRTYEDPLRAAIRTHTHSRPYRPLASETRPSPGGGHTPAIEAGLIAIEPIPGWLEPHEARSLLESTAAALSNPCLPSNVLEIGSYLGRSTVGLATVAGRVCASGRVFAIDPHNGEVGSRDHGIEQTGDTYDAFVHNLEAAGVDSHVTALRMPTADVDWQLPLALLFVDGLHDYPSVARDCLSAEDCVADGGVIAFHDYAPYFPGVVTFVQELLGSGRFSVLAHEGSLVTLLKNRGRHEKRPGAPAIRQPPPLVSCVMPTCDRPDWVARAIRCFERLDTGDKELVVIDSGMESVEHLCHGRPDIRYVRVRTPLSLGGLRNLACDMSGGAAILHWDDDDWSASWRAGYQLQELAAAPGAQVCGLTSVLFSNPEHTRAWRYTYPYSQRPWLAGGTLCYRKAFWKSHPFLEIGEGEDTHFVWTAEPGDLVSCDVQTFYVAHVHPGNTSAKACEGPLWSEYPPRQIQRLMDNEAT